MVVRLVYCKDCENFKVMPTSLRTKPIRCFCALDQQNRIGETGHSCPRYKERIKTMTNGERIARDIGFLIGRYERGEINAVDLVTKVDSLTFKECGTCVFNPDTCMDIEGASCEAGYINWLTQEVDY